VFRYTRHVHFEDVDAAQILFFPRFLTYCHEAMEAFFGGLEGGYVRLIKVRKIGLPAVHLEVDFKAPLGYGDVAEIDVTVERIGSSSCALNYTITRARDRVVSATVKHVCVVSDLTALAKIPIPDDVRALLSLHMT
jgi:4-hydroxybenzoyl-CoA thioesterase